MEMNFKINTDGLLRRFFWTGQVMHYIDPKAPLDPNETDARHPALCGLRPMWPAVWWGVDDSAEYFDADRGKELTDCNICLASLLNNGRGELGVRAAE